VARYTSAFGAEASKDTPDPLATRLCKWGVRPLFSVRAMHLPLKENGEHGAAEPTAYKAKTIASTLGTQHSRVHDSAHSIYHATSFSMPGMRGIRKGLAVRFDTHAKDLVGV
jgi:hypothetical protein